MLYPHVSQLDPYLNIGIMSSGVTGGADGYAAGFNSLPPLKSLIKNGLEKTMKVFWEKYLDRIPYLFQGNDLPPEPIKGAYIIWYDSHKEHITVRVGSGNIKQRLEEHRKDDCILHYAQYGPLLVTWTKLQPAHRGGVERYLGDTLEPRIGCRFPDVPPISVNLPWE